MGAPTGNKNAAKSNRMWGSAIKRAIAQSDQDTLRKLADKLIEMALEGDIQAMREVGDRIEGKAVQVTQLTGEDGGPVITRVENVIVDPKE